MWIWSWRWFRRRASVCTGAGHQHNSPATSNSSRARATRVTAARVSRVLEPAAGFAHVRAGHKVGIEQLIAYCTHDQVGSALGRLRFAAADVPRPKLVQNLRCAPIGTLLMPPTHSRAHAVLTMLACAERQHFCAARRRRPDRRARCARRRAPRPLMVSRTMRPAAQRCGDGPRRPSSAADRRPIAMRWRTRRRAEVTPQVTFRSQLGHNRL